MSTCLRLALISWMGLAHALPPWVAKKELILQPREEVYWDNPKLAQKMREERAIPVSVRTSTVNKKIHLDLRGAGLIHRSLDQAYAAAMDLGHAETWSSYFKQANYNDSRMQLAVRIEIFFHAAEMLVQFQSEAGKSPQRYLLWEVLAGNFKGLKGEFIFSSDDAQHTRVSVVAEDDTETLPLPRTLTALVFEVALQKIAGSMRNHIENEPSKTVSVEP